MASKTLALKVFRDGELVDTHTLSQDVIKIGKLKSNHLCLEDDAVARMHAVIEVSGEDIRVIDLGSTTGTIVNGHRIDKNAVLNEGDTLSFGPYRIEVGFSEFVPSVSTPPVATVQSIGASLGVPGAMGARSPQAVPFATRESLPVDVSEVEVQSGTRVAEVVAVYGNTVLDVQHVGQVKNRRPHAPIWLSLGGVLVLSGIGLLGYEISQDWQGYREQVKQAQETGATMPQMPGTGLWALGFGLAVLGLIPFGYGLVLSRDYANSDYTIGEGHGASFHVPPQGLPEPTAYPLVRSSGHDFSLNFTQDMEGDVSFDGQTIPLSQLVSSGRASSTGSGSYSFPLPPGANSHVNYQGVHFYVNSVAPGAVLARQTETDKPFWIYNGGSAVVIGSLLLLAQLARPDSGSLGLEDDQEGNRFVGYINQPDQPPEEEEPPPVEVMENSNEEAGGSGQRHAGEEGKMGNPSAKQKSGLYAIKGPQNAIPQLARNFDPEMAARQAGILGMMQQESGHFLASPHGGAFAVGNDDADVWGGLTGTEVGEAYGVGGLGLVGTGRGGGGTGEGTLGFGNTGLIGKGGGGGSGSGYGRGSGAGFGGRDSRVPTVRQATANVQGALDPDIIRRIVRAHINEVRHCYNTGLAKDPNLKGRVSIQFTIGSTGKVPVAVVQSTSVKDASVGNCIASAVKRWSFPKPQGGGTVIVSYPFVLSPG